MTIIPPLREAGPHSTLGKEYGVPGIIRFINLLGRLKEIKHAC